MVNKDSIQIAMELGPPVLESSTKISKLHGPIDSEHKFHKARIENWPPIELWESHYLEPEVQLLKL